VKCAWEGADAYAEGESYEALDNDARYERGGSEGAGGGGALGAALDALSDMFLVDEEDEEVEYEESHPIRKQGDAKQENQRQRDEEKQRVKGSVRAQALVVAKGKPKGGGYGPGPTVQALARADEMLEVCCWMGSAVMAGLGAFLAGLLPGAIVFFMATVAAGVAAVFAQATSANGEVRRGRQVREVLQQQQQQQQQRQRSPQGMAQRKQAQRKAAVQSNAMAKLQEEREWREGEGKREARHAQLKALAAHNAKLPSVPATPSHAASRELESFLDDDLHAQAAEFGVAEGILAYEMMLEGSHGHEDLEGNRHEEEEEEVISPPARLSKHMYYKELPDGTRAYSVRQEPANSSSNLQAWDSRKPRRPPASASLPEAPEDEQTRQMDIKFQEAKLRARRRLWEEEEARERQIAQEANARGQVGQTVSHGEVAVATRPVQSPSRPISTKRASLHGHDAMQLEAEERRAWAEKSVRGRPSGANAFSEQYQSSVVSQTYRIGRCMQELERCQKAESDMQETLREHRGRLQETQAALATATEKCDSLEGEFLAAKEKFDKARTEAASLKQAIWEAGVVEKGVATDPRDQSIAPMKLNQKFRDVYSYHSPKNVDVVAKPPVPVMKSRLAIVAQEKEAAAANMGVAESALEKESVTLRALMSVVQEETKTIAVVEAEAVAAAAARRIVEERLARIDSERVTSPPWETDARGPSREMRF